MEDWAEIRRLHCAEGLSQSEIARRLGIARNTVARALASDRPPRYQRAPRGSIVEPVEPQIRALLASYPKMPATVIAERIGWERSLTVLKDRIRQIRPEYRGVDPADRLAFEPGELAQMDLWQPDYEIPVGFGQAKKLWVLAMTLGHSRVTDGVLLPGRQGGDLLSGMWILLERLGRVPRAVVWDREAAIAPTGKPTHLAAGFFGTLAVKPIIAPRKDPEFKGGIERSNQFFESSFLPGRVFGSPEDFQAQFETWLQRANQRTMRRLHGRPADFLEIDRQAMLELPPLTPTVGLGTRVRLARDYYVRLDGNDYSVDPRFIGRHVEAVASLSEVVIRCDGQLAGRHPRCWAGHQVITDPEHVQIAARLRRHYREASKPRPVRHHTGGHPVQLRALSDYDALFGVDFDQPRHGNGSKEQGGAQRS